MKLKGIIIVFIIITSILFNYYIVFAHDTTNDITISDFEKNKIKCEYKFPIDTSDKKEWSNLESHDEMLDVCEIPDTILKDMSTDELINIVLDYPLLIDILAYDSWNDGLEALSQDFNGIRELLNREDGAEKLLNAYCKSEITDSESQTDLDEVLTIEFMEAALSQEEIIEQFDEKQLDQLSDEAEEKYTKKCENKMYKTFEGSIYENMYENGTLDEIDADCVFQKSNNSELCSYQIIIYTKKGKPVLAYLMDETLTKEQINSINKKYKKAYPKATFVSNSTSKYNCHSYAWYKTSTKNSTWINSPKAFINESKYIGKKPSKKNQKAVWINAASNSYYEHSGIVYSYKNKNSFMIQSKWGKAPLMRHKENYSPYGGTIKYYSY